jgi:hypothetical protein
MAKVIKFNLILDNNPVRGLDGLRDNFNIEDLLGAYRNGSLKLWLESRELAREIAELEKISGDDISAARELCRIFQADCAKEQLEAAAYPFEFRQKEAEQLRQYKSLTEQKNEVIRAYHEDYEKLLEKLEEKGEDYAFVKPGLAQLFGNYLGLFTMNIGRFYNRFIFDFPLVVLGVLANDNLRPFLVSAADAGSREKDHVFADSMENIFMDITMPQRMQSSFLERYRSKIPQPLLRRCSSQEELDELRNTFENLAVLQGASSGASILILNGASSEAAITKKKLKDLSPPFTYIAKDLFNYPPHVKTFSGATEGYWKDIQPKGKQFLVIKMESGNVVRNAGKNGEELKAEDVNSKFPILDGIDYKSNNAGHQLVYMEV